MCVFLFSSVANMFSSVENILHPCVKNRRFTFHLSRIMVGILQKGHFGCLTFVLCYLIVVFVTLSPMAVSSKSEKRDFHIDYDRDQFVKDGQAFQYISGSIHYFRIPPFYWRDRLLRMKAAGLNAVQFYVPWNMHEPEEGKFVFSGQWDLDQFLNNVRDLEMVALVRAGPYICGEWDFGGIPWWIGKYQSIKPRSSDPKWLSYVTKWFNVLLPKLIPHLYKNGGPIVMVQIENEYGSRSQSCDSIQYKALIRDMAHDQLGYDTQLYTTDGGGLGYLKCGYFPGGVYPTVDFGTDSPSGVEKSFAAQRTYAPRGPRVNSEFYLGWLDHWGTAWNQNTKVDDILSTMRSFHALNASYNFYMFEGGSNFGFTPCWYITQSYDYDAPLTESGNYTAKYWAIRKLIKKMTGGTRAIPPPKPPIPAANVGVVGVHQVGSVLDHYLSGEGTDGVERAIKNRYPLAFEDLNLTNGFVLYTARIPRSGVSLTLRIPGLRDRAQIMVNKAFVGNMAADKIGSSEKRLQLNISGTEGDVLQVLVESMGRREDGTYLDRKGIVSNVTLQGTNLTDWTHYPLEYLERFAEKIKNSGIHRATGNENSGFIPSFYVGKFSVPPGHDTYFHPGGWGKGIVLINGFNLGRYWPSMGPQVTLWVPQSILLPNQTNSVTILELESPGNCRESQPGIHCSVKFVSQPWLNKTVRSGL